MFYKKLVYAIVCASLTLLSTNTFAGGVTLGATRVIYPSTSKQISLPLKNTDNNAAFLLQSWVENEASVKTDDVLITPPVFVINPGRENLLRIIYTGNPLPSDRETLFWLSVKAIPSMGKENADGNSLQLAIVNRIKMFYRPAGLEDNADEAHQQLRFSRNGNALTIDNPSPFYLTVVNLQVGGKNLPGVMVAPRNKYTLNIPGNASGEITYQTINDYGAMTKKETGIRN